MNLRLEALIGGWSLPGTLSQNMNRNAVDRLLMSSGGFFGRCEKKSHECDILVLADLVPLADMFCYADIFPQ